MPKKYPENTEQAPVAFKDGSEFYTTKERSKIMGKIKGQNTKPELMLRKSLWHLGYRYRLHIKGLPGSPDIVFKKQKIAIFIDGEFWHGHHWEQRKKSIKTNQAYWIPKIEKNMSRDQEATAKLESAGWLVLRYWSKQVINELDICVEEIIYHLGFRK